MPIKNQDLLSMLPDGTNYLTFEQMNTIINYQKLWSNLSMWMRSYVYSRLGDHSNLSAVANRLYSIPTELYNLLILFYGPEITQNIVNYFLTFVISATSVIDGIKNNDTEVISSNTRQCYQNAANFAEFLARINAYWGVSQWENLLYQYIQLKIEQIIAIAQGNYPREIIIHDTVDNITSIMGTYMASGIIARFIPIQTESS